MRDRSRLRPSPAMAVALLALFVSLGGVGYAAATIGSAQVKNNSLRGKDIRNSTITGKDVKNSGLGGADLKNGSVTSKDVKDNDLTGGDVEDSSLTGTDVQDSSLTGTDVQDSSLTGTDVQDETLTGTDIVESTLGRVPSAQDAATLNGVPVSGFLRTGTRVYTAGSGQNLAYTDNAAQATLNVPAGQYSIVAKTSIANNDATPDNITCTLRRNGTTLDTTMALIGGDTSTGPDAAEVVPFPLVAVYTGAASSFTVNCTNDSDNKYSDAHIIATRVN